MEWVRLFLMLLTIAGVLAIALAWSNPVDRVWAELKGDDRNAD